jgi:opacity protein-like surface antigen
MKKVLLVAAATVALSTSVMADDNMFYLRGDLGMNKFEAIKPGNVKLKTKWSAGLDLGVGYYVMDNVRAELVWAHPFNVEGKKNFTEDGVSVSAKRKATIDALLVKAYVDVADLGIAKLFVGGGFGLSMIKDKSTANYTEAGQTESIRGSSKKKNDLAWTLGVGAGFDVADGVKVDVQYAYTDFGKTKTRKVDEVKFEGSRYRSHAVKVGVRFDI